MGIYSCIEQCEGCRHLEGSIKYGAVCEVYMRPYAKWHKLGGCEGATHVKRETAPEQKQRVGQQKQKKR